MRWNYFCYGARGRPKLQTKMGLAFLCYGQNMLGEHTTAVDAITMGHQKPRMIFN